MAQVKQVRKYTKMIRISTLWAAVLFGTLFVLAGFFFQPSFAQAPAPSTVVFTGARLIDGTGRAPLEQGLRRQIPAGAVRVDVTGKTIVPGLINAHAHVNADPESTLPVRSQLIAQLRLYADYGVTTVFVLGTTPADVHEALQLRDEQAHETLDRARLYAAGPSIRAAKTPDEARQNVDRYADMKVDIIKMHINGNSSDMTPEVYGALIDQAHKRGLRVAAHMYYLKGLMNAGVDIFAHSVRDQDVPAAFLAGLKRRNVGYIATLTRDLSIFVYETTPAFFSDPFFVKHEPSYRKQMTILKDPVLQETTRNSREAQSIKQALQQASRNLKILSDAGVPIAMGTDTGAQVGRWQGYFEHTELEMMVKAGLTPMQALVAATGGAARVTKLDGQLGTLEPGKFADFVVLNANPLSDIRNTRQVESVWIAGRQLPKMKESN